MSCLSSRVVVRWANGALLHFADALTMDKVIPSTCLALGACIPAARDSEEQKHEHGLHGAAVYIQHVDALNLMSSMYGAAKEFFARSKRQQSMAAAFRPADEQSFGSGEDTKCN